MLFKESPEKFWNLIAKKYARSSIPDRTAYETKIARLKTYLQADMRVLDIGCATGTQCGDIADSVQQVNGIDISNDLLDIARQRMADRGITNVGFSQNSPFDGRFTAGSFDCIMAFHVLHFFDDLDAIVSRIHELLTPGGIFISETGCLGERGKFLGNILQTMGRVGLLPTMSFLTNQQIESALQNAGFEILEKTKFSQAADAEFTYIAKRKQA